MKKLKQYVSWELMLWLGAIAFVCTINPTVPQTHTLCLWHNLGFDYCLGCGLGRSMAWVLRGDFVHAWAMHPMGIVAWVVILWQIHSLITRKRNSGFTR